MSSQFSEVNVRLGITVDTSQVAAWAQGINQAAATTEAGARRIRAAINDINAATSSLAFSSASPGFLDAGRLGAVNAELRTMQSLMATMERTRLGALSALTAGIPPTGAPYARAGLLPPPQLALPAGAGVPYGAAQRALPVGTIPTSTAPIPAGTYAVTSNGQVIPTYSSQQLLNQYQASGGRGLFAGSGSGVGLPPGGGGGGTGIFPPAGPGGPGRDYFGEFKTGFFGTSGRSLVEQAGQAAKFSVLYGTAYAALFAFSQGLQTAIDSAVSFNNSLAELTIAVGNTQEENLGFASRLGEEATRFGIAPEEGVQAGARAIGLFDLAGQPADIREAQAIQAARVTSGLSFVTGSEPQQITKDIGALAGAFELQASSLSQIADLDAYFSRQFGVETGSTLETGAQIGTLGREAGFSLEEVIALSAQVQARTGQTPAAVAGLLSQFFGRAGDPAMREQFAQLGIDVTASFRDQIEQLAGLDIGPELKNQLINAFGRGRAGGAAATIIETFPEVQEKVALAETEAPGTAAAQLEQRLNNFGGIMATLGGNLRELAVNIGNSGLLDILGILVLGLNAFVDAINPIFAFLASFNGDPFLRFIRDAVIALGIFSLALKTSAGQAVAGRIATSLAARGQGLGLAGPLSIYGKSPQAITGIGAQATAGGVLRGAPLAAGEFLGSTAGVATAFVALALTAFNVAKGLEAVGQAADGVEAATQFGVQAFEEPTAEGLSTEAKNIRAAAEEAKRAAEEPIKFAGVLPVPALISPVARLFGFEGRAGDLTGRDEAAASLAEEQAAFYEGAAKRQEQLEAQTDVGVFGDTDQATIEGLNSSLETLAINGVTAERRIRLLSDAFLDVGKKGEDTVKNAVLPTAADVITARIGENEDLFAGVFEGQTFTQAEELNAGAQGRTAAEMQAFQYQNIIQENAVAVQAAISENLPTTIGAGGLTPRRMSEIVDAVITSGLGMELEDVPAAFRTVLADAINDAIRGGGVTQGAAGGGKIEGNLAKGLAAIFETQFQEAQAALVGGDSLGQLNLLRDRWQALEQLAKRTEAGPALKSILVQRDQALAQFVDAQLADSARLREAAQASAGSLAEVRRIGQRFARRDLRRVTRGGSIDAIIGVMNGANRQAIRAVLEELRTAARIAQAAADASAALTSGLSSAVYRFVPGISGAVNQAAADQQKADDLAAQAHRAAEAARRSAPQRGYKGDYYQDPTGRFGGGGAAEATETAGQIAAAQAAANAARTNDAVAQARAGVQAAAADLAAAKPGTVEYYSALQQYYEAKRALTEAITSTENAQILARAADRGSDLVLAEANLRVARNNLAQETQGTLAYFEALQAFHEAQAALSEAIRAYKFTQDQLAGDVTDPVDQARAELRNARRQLRYDQRNNTGPDARAASRLEVRIQEAALQQTKFDQWLTDLQNQEQLENIGHAQYIRTLERRINRLKDVKNRTRQEQDQLVQLQLTLQEAQKAMSAQFNIGNIRIPTPYEARRYIEEQKLARDKALGGGGGSGPEGPLGPGTGPQQPQTTNYQNYVQIDGADTGQVRRIIVEVLGRPAINARSTKTSKR